VIDEVGALSSSQREQLASELRSYPPQLQLQIWILDSLGDEPIENLSIRATDAWKLGTAKEDRGALLLIALKDRRMRLEVGQGLEGEITDLQSSRILDEILRPAFRAEAYFEGLVLASRHVYKLAGGNPTLSAPRRAARDGRSRSNIYGVLFFFIVVMVLKGLGLGGRGRRSRFYGGGGWGSSGSFGSFGGGGGGGWSGGGGGFSGGGSSGSW